VSDFKFTRDMKVDYVTEPASLNVLCIDACTVSQELEELMSVKWFSVEEQHWEAKEKNRIYPAGIVASTQFNRELIKINR
jgi:hypothetical protein